MSAFYQFILKWLDLSFLVVGPRSCGKTVLIKSFVDKAKRNGTLVVSGSKGFTMWGDPFLASAKLLVIFPGVN